MWLHNIEFLKEQGYRIRADKYGYEVYHNEEWLFGAGIADTTKRMHWQHARKNLTNNLESAWSIAHQHYQSNKKPELSDPIKEKSND